MRVTVLGMGRMGQALAGRLLEAGQSVTVWNRTPGRAGSLVSAGAREQPSIASAVAGAEVVITILTNDAAVREVALGPGGVAESLAEGATYVDSSTVSPRLTSDLDVAFPRFAALPVLGAPPLVRTGQATFLIGGRTEVLSGLTPIVEALSGRTYTYQKPAQAIVAKLAVNLMLLSAVVTLSEAFALGRDGGLSDDQLRHVLGESVMLPPGIRNRFEGILVGGQDSWWTTALGSKDAGLAAQTESEAGVALPLAEVVRDRYAAAAAAGLGDEDISAVARIYDQRP